MLAKIRLEGGASGFWRLDACHATVVSRSLALVIRSSVEL